MVVGVELVGGEYWAKELLALAVAVVVVVAAAVIDDAPNERLVDFVWGYG